MNRKHVTIRIDRRVFYPVLAIALAVAFAIVAPPRAQKVQEEFADKFKIADDTGGVAVAASADGRFVFVAGKKGVIVSDDYGKTGSWVQTVRMK